MHHAKLTSFDCADPLMLGTVCNQTTGAVYNLNDNCADVGVSEECQLTLAARAVIFLDDSWWQKKNTQIVKQDISRGFGWGSLPVTMDRTDHSVCLRIQDFILKIKLFF